MGTLKSTFDATRTFSRKIWPQFLTRYNIAYWYNNYIIIFFLLGKLSALSNISKMKLSQNYLSSLNFLVNYFDKCAIAKKKNLFLGLLFQRTCQYINIFLLYLKGQAKTLSKNKMHSFLGWLFEIFLKCSGIRSGMRLEVIYEA